MGSMGQESPVLCYMAQGSYEDNKANNYLARSSKESDQQYNILISHKGDQETALKGRTGSSHYAKAYMRFNHDSIHEQDEE